MGGTCQRGTDTIVNEDRNVFPLVTQTMDLFCRTRLVIISRRSKTVREDDNARVGIIDDLIV